jgi:hypothetical protein
MGAGGLRMKILMGLGSTGQYNNNRSVASEQAFLYAVT